MIAAKSKFFIDPSRSNPSSCCCCSCQRIVKLQFKSILQFPMRQFLLLLLVAVVVVPMISINSVHSQSLICARIPNLTAQQVRICQSGPEILSVIRSGIQLALSECEQLFRYRKPLHSAWNCSEWLRNSTNRLYLDISDPMIEGTKEASFAHALFSAGVTHSLSEACTRGNFSYCSCGAQSGQTLNGAGDQHWSRESAPPLDDNWKPVPFSSKGWKWHGCGQNVDFGSEIARLFLDSPEYRKTTPYGLLNLHNNLVGRRTVKDELISRCQCHGYSGSCTVRTCWRTLNDFQNAAHSLRSRYTAAKQVSYGWLIQSYRTKYEALASHRSTTSISLNPSVSSSSSSISASHQHHHHHHHHRFSSAHQRNHPKVLTKLEQLNRIEELARNQSQFETNQPSLMRHLSVTSDTTTTTSSTSSSNSQSLSTGGVRRRDIIYLKPSINHCTLSDVNLFLQTNLTCVVADHGSLSSPKLSAATPALPADKDWSIQYGQCDSLCCGRGYRPRVQWRTEQCECQFQFCCSISCTKHCSVPVTEYECL